MLLLGAGKVELGLVQIGVGPLHARLLQGDIGLGNGDARLLLAHGRFKSRGFDAGQHLALLDRRAEIHVELADLAGKLRAHINGDERVDRARGRDDAAHIVAGKLNGLDVERSARALLPIIIAAAGGQRRD
jgi:hypothetical protein